MNKYYIFGNVWTVKKILRVTYRSTMKLVQLQPQPSTEPINNNEKIIVVPENILNIGNFSTVVCSKYEW